MKPEDKWAIISFRRQQARETVLEAEAVLGLPRGTPRTAVNRAYYAAYYEVMALLQLEGVATRKHVGALRMFNLHFIKSQRLPTRMYALLQELFEERMEDDYADMAQVTREDAEEACRKAREFVDAIEAFFEGLPPSSDPKPQT